MNWDFALIVASVDGRHVPLDVYESKAVPVGAEVPLIHGMQGTTCRRSRRGRRREPERRVAGPYGTKNTPRSSSVVEMGPPLRNETAFHW